MKILPVVFTWTEIVTRDGEALTAMVPLKRYGNVAARQYSVGEEYPLVVVETRSRASHGHYFAAIAEGFNNLPENIAARFPSPEFLRKWALCESGICDELDITFDNETDAGRQVKFYRGHDHYAQITKIGTRVIIRTARSQSMRVMDKEAFEASKRAVLDTIANLIDVKRKELEQAAGRSA